MKQKVDANYRWKITWRVMLAIIGGYVLTNQISILLSLLLPIPKSDAVMTALLLSFIVYSVIVIWVFSVSSLKKVLWGMTGAILSTGVLTALVYFLGAAK